MILCILNIRNEINFVQADTRIAFLKGKKIRKTLHENEWWFSVIDVVEVLTESSNARDYWYKMKIRVEQEAGTQLSTTETGIVRWEKI